MGSSSKFPHNYNMKTVICIFIVFIAHDKFIPTDGQLFFIDKDPAVPSLLEGELCDCNSKVLPIVMSTSNAKSIKLRDEINHKFENLYEPAMDTEESGNSEDENTSQSVDSLTRPKRESKLIITKTKTPSFMWGNMLTIRSVGPIKNLMNANADTGFEIKEFQMKEINAEKIKTRRRKRAADKLSKRIRISAKDVKGSKSKVINKRSIFDEHPNSECPAIQNLRQRNDLDNDMILQYLPEVGGDCPSCGAKYVNQHEAGCQCGGCMQCECRPPITAVVQHRPHYIEYRNDGTPITYVPGRVAAHNPIVQSPRYVFDQFGHKYLENNGNLRLVMPDHIVGDAASSYHDPEEALYFNKIREILYGYKDFQDWNSQNQVGELAPSIIDQQRAVLKFLRDIVKNRYNEPSNQIPVTVENAFDDVRNAAALQTNQLSVDEDDAIVEDNVIRIK